MQDEKKIIEFERLDEVAKKTNGSLKNLADKLNISPQAVYAWREKGIPFKQYSNLEKLGINPEFIKTGEGNMLLIESNIANDLIPARAFGAEDINNFDIKTVSFYVLEDIKEAMQNKINEIDRFLKAVNNEE